MARARKHPLKLTGNISWSGVTGDEVIGVVVKKATMPSPDKIILEFESDGYQYGVSLNRDFGERFHGSFEGQKGPARSPVVASCVLYYNLEGYLLFGKWQEDGWDYRWWAELTAVEQFAHKKSE